MTKRRLRPDEQELWNRVARTTDRMHPAKPKPEMPSLSDVAPDTPPSAKAKQPIQPFEMGTRASTVVVPQTKSQPPVVMDRKAYDRMKRGKLKPEGRIDLHGMTQEQAHAALNAFIMSAFTQEKRLVLVITGKGKKVEDHGPIPVRPGVLRRNAPHWLQNPPLNQVVMQVTQAHLRHGGSGAYYVYLKRRR